VGALADGNADLADPARLRRRLAEDGYLYLPGLLDAAAVAAARRAVFARLHAVGEVRAPPEHGIATGESRRAEEVADLGAFLAEIAQGAALRAVTHGGTLAALMVLLLDAPARPFDFLWLRFMTPGRASPLHFDHVYMNRGSQRVLTAWVPLGPAPPEDGPLLIVENSHRFQALIEAYRGLDVDREATCSGSLDDNPIDLAERHGTRLLTADFQAGDVVVFGMFTLHGSFDNTSPQGRVRLSCDARYQPTADPMDPRWFGADPPGHDGQGYGALSAAKPLTSAPLRR
jgi:hypothetical protein